MSTLYPLPASIRAADLIRQALALFESDREGAWRCLNDASRVLSPDQDCAVDTSVPALKPGGLATWQAQRTLAYIEAHLASKMDVDDLASVVALSRSHFSRAFRHCVGLTPMRYILVRRVERAKALIRGTREPLAEVALACGFADQAHLNRRFRNLVGISPGRWRRSNAPMPTRQRPRDAQVPARAAVQARASLGSLKEGSPAVQV